MFFEKLCLYFVSHVSFQLQIWSPFTIPLNNEESEHLGEAERPVYTHEEYINLVLNSGHVMTHDQTQQNTTEDPRMMAFFDSLVQRELEGWSSEDESEESAQEVLEREALPLSLNTNDDDSDNMESYSPFTLAFASILASGSNNENSNTNMAQFQAIVSELRASNQSAQQHMVINEQDGLPTPPPSQSQASARVPSSLMPGQSYLPTRQNISDLISQKRKEYLNNARRVNLEVRRKNRRYRQQTESDEEANNRRSHHVCIGSTEPPRHSEASRLSEGHTEPIGHSEREHDVAVNIVFKGTNSQVNENENDMTAENPCNHLSLNEGVTSEQVNALIRSSHTEKVKRLKEIKLRMKDEDSEIPNCSSSTIQHCTTPPVISSSTPPHCSSKAAVKSSSQKSMQSSTNTLTLSTINKPSHSNEKEKFLSSCTTNSQSLSPSAAQAGCSKSNHGGGIGPHLTKDLSQSSSSTETLTVQSEETSQSPTDLTESNHITWAEFSRFKNRVERARKHYRKRNDSDT